MGNYVSCALSSPTGKQLRSTEVILPSGEVQQLHAPTTAAELMLESPNFFVVNSQSLQIGRRFSALDADEDLEPANVYVMFPMKRRNSVVTAADMGRLFLAAKRGSSGDLKVRDLQEEEEEEKEDEVPRLNLEEVIEEFSTPDFKYRLSVSRSKKPLLETITELEEPLPYSRY